LAFATATASVTHWKNQSKTKALLSLGGLMRIEVRDGLESPGEVAPLVAAVYPPEVLATAVWRDVVSARATLRILVYDVDMLISAVGLLFRRGTIYGTATDIAGIGGVMTHPDARRRGFGKAAMEAAHEVIVRDHGSAFGLLFCETRNYGFYQGLGWRFFDGIVIAEQPNSTGPYQVMAPFVRPFHGKTPPGGTIDLCGLPW
jgi:GNAT superfamily N-acetyltransferase